jgi:hypothetical protein
LTLAGVIVDLVLDVKTIYPGHYDGSNHLANDPLRLYEEIESFYAASRDLGNGIYTPLQMLEAVWRIPVWDMEFPNNDGDQNDEESGSSSMDEVDHWARRATSLSQER